MDLKSSLFDSIRIKSKASVAAERAKERMCQHPGCTLAGPHKAPMGRNREGQYVYMCLPHVQAYNKTYNYFQGMTDGAIDPAKVAAFQQAQGNLSQSLGRLLATVEAYPDLKSNQNFLALQSQLEGTENRINISIKDYNSAVQSYNTTIRTFPDAIGAKIFYGSKPMTPFQATAPNADRAPTVKF